MKKIIITLLLFILSLGILIAKEKIVVPQKFGHSPKAAETKISIPDNSSGKAKEFFENAKKQIGIVKTYDFSNGYYTTNSGYPPEDTGVCTDVIGRAFDITHKTELRKLVDADIKKAPKKYQVNFDSYINFRRVKVLNIFLSRQAKILTKEMIPGDVQNLSEWQTGDIVTFEKLSGEKGLWHIGIISNERDASGVPYMIDNHGYGTDIRITPLDWPTEIMGHYRYF